MFFIDLVSTNGSVMVISPAHCAANLSLFREATINLAIFINTMTSFVIFRNLGPFYLLCISNLIFFKNRTFRIEQPIGPSNILELISPCIC